MVVNTLLQDTLKRHGYSVTKPRQTVFKAINDSTSPLTMAELVQSVGNTTDRASVYRTIELFEQLGIVLRLQQGWKYRLELSDLFTHHHHHLTCDNCGASIAFDEPDQLVQMIRQASEAEGFMAHAHQLEITGLCASCRQHNAEKVRKT